MKYLDEYRDEALAKKLLREIERRLSRGCTIMEVCGGQTHAIVKHGIDCLLPEQIQLVHGPGCPVCVTPVEMIDKAHAIAARPEIIRNFSLLVSQMRVPPAMASILRSPHNRVQGFLGSGHVCTVMGCREYEAISAPYSVPIVITGFEPLDILEGY